MLDAGVAQALRHDDRRVAITGASGWIGLATLDLLQRALGDQFEARVQCFGSTARMLDLGAGRRVRQHALADLPGLGPGRVQLLHFAFLTKDRAEAMSEEAYRAANRAIADQLFDALDRLEVEAVFLASSGAAAKVDDPSASAAMRLYGAVKRDDEARLAAWADTRGRRAVIGRIFNITGPYINKHASYAMASFILDALAGRPIAVRAPRPVIRSYVAVRELVSLVFALLGGGPDGVTRFDSGGEPLELGEVAHVVAGVLGGQVERAVVTDPVPDRYVGDGAGYAALLRRHRLTPVMLDRQVTETAAYLAGTDR